MEFLGEIPTNRVAVIKRTMDEFKSQPFSLHLSKIGYFKRPEGKIYWIGIENNDTLFKINRKLRQKLTDRGFKLEDREYKPHITIGRKVILKDDFDTGELDDAVRKIKIDINKVDLMKSEFLNGKLIHSLMYSRRLL